jgi:hypothetical protein
MFKGAGALGAGLLAAGLAAAALETQLTEPPGWLLPASWILGLSGSIFLLIAMAGGITAGLRHAQEWAVRRPASPLEIEGLMERRRWGRKWYRLSHQMNEAEKSLYLTLHRRMGGPIGLSCYVTNPFHQRHMWRFASSEQDVMVRYPQDFKEASHLAEPPLGRYKVEWRGTARGLLKPKVRRLAKESFVLE